MYYARYDAPNFRARFLGNFTAQLFEKSIIERWRLQLSRSIRRSIRSKYPLVPVSDRAVLSPEYITLPKAAFQGDTLIWALAGLTGAVLSCLPNYAAVFYLLALSFNVSELLLYIRDSTFPTDCYDFLQPSYRQNRIF